MNSSQSESRQALRHRVLQVAIVGVMLVVLAECLGTVHAGTCWLHRMDVGSCKQPQRRFVSRNECCGGNGAAPSNLGFTESDMNDQEWFMAAAIGEGTSCSSCLESCQSSNCGPNKRCAMRNGRPKCICAPICKKSLAHPRGHHLPASANATSTNQRNRRYSDEANHNADMPTSVNQWRRKRRTDDSSIDVHHNGTWHAVSVVMEPGAFYNPVCGTDGHTYKTECQLKKRACRRDLSQLAVAYRGVCQSTCRNVLCPTGMYCLQDQYLSPHCVNCTWKCPTRSFGADGLLNANSAAVAGKGVRRHQVCGVDGRTYRNVCEIRRAACRQGRAIPVAYRGPCNQTALSAGTEGATVLNNSSSTTNICSTVRCHHRHVCLADGATHRPRCVSCTSKCPRSRRQLHQQHQPQHDHQQMRVQLMAATSTTAGLQLPADLSDDPMPTTICGADNHTYASWCHMLQKSCAIGVYIDVQHIGACRQQDHQRRQPHTSTVNTTNSTIQYDDVKLG